MAMRIATPDYRSRSRPRIDEYARTLHGTGAIAQNERLPNNPFHGEFIIIDDVIKAKVTVRRQHWVVRKFG